VPARVRQHEGGHHVARRAGQLQAGQLPQRRQQGIFARRHRDQRGRHAQANRRLRPIADRAAQPDDLAWHLVARGVTEHQQLRNLARAHAINLARLFGPLSVPSR